MIVQMSSRAIGSVLLLGVALVANANATPFTPITEKELQRCEEAFPQYFKPNLVRETRTVVKPKLKPKRQWFQFWTYRAAENSDSASTSLESQPEQDKVQDLNGPFRALIREVTEISRNERAIENSPALNQLFSDLYSILHRELMTSEKDFLYRQDSSIQSKMNFALETLIQYTTLFDRDGSTLQHYLTSLIIRMIRAHYFHWVGTSRLYGTNSLENLKFYLSKTLTELQLDQLARSHGMDLRDALVPLVAERDLRQFETAQAKALEKVLVKTQQSIAGLEATHALEKQPANAFADALPIAEAILVHEASPSE